MIKICFANSRAETVISANQGRQDIKQPLIKKNTRGFSETAASGQAA
jgi:hypothetical protein